MHSLMPGQVCEQGCGVRFDAVPPDIHEWPVKFHTEVPIEGAGVVHVTTEPLDCRYDHWGTSVVLWRYCDNAIIERAYLTGSACAASTADEMHIYWCDLETLALCVQGVPYALHIIDEYFDRKQRELGIG